MQHVSASPACAESGADNIEQKLSNKIYALTQENNRIRKRHSNFYSVLEKMIELTQAANVASSSSSSVPLQLNVSTNRMPPPEYFESTYRDEYDVKKVQFED